MKTEGNLETLLVALVKGEVMGSVRLTSTQRRSASIHCLYVYKYYRKKGVGRLLINASCELAAKDACETFGLSVHKRNKGAIAFYEKCGLRFAYEYDDGMILMSKQIKGEKND